MSGRRSARWRRSRVAVRRVVRQTRLAVSSVWLLWRSSLQIRVITSTLVVGIAALVILGAYLSDRIRDGLFDKRVAQLLEESARSSRSAQTTLSSSTATTAAEVQRLFYDLVPALKLGGSGEQEVFLRHSPLDPPRLLVNDVSTRPELNVLLQPALREVILKQESQAWTSVAIPTDSGQRVEPGVLVGSMVTVPAAGQYELYFLYSLEPEGLTLAFVQRVLGAAALGLVVLLGAMTWLVTRQAVHPVRSAARVAERFAEGHLSERMLVKGVDEMATLARSFNEMAASLQDQIGRMEEMSLLQRRFVSDVSHELRTPLTTIRMAAEVIHDARGGLDPAAERSAELLTAQLDRFEDLLADLLEISRFDAGAAMLDADSLDVRDVVTNAVEQAAPLAERKGSWLSVSLPERPMVADIDPRRIERVLRNLLVNAIEHAEGQTVEVHVAGDARAVAVVVRDHGIGMSLDEADHVFDRFWRADPARARTTGGTGLGLAISIEDAHLHGGWLQAWGARGKGAAFRLTLPRRAGIILTSSPLSLVPEDEPAPPPPALSPSAAALDPASVPDLGRWDR